MAYCTECGKEAAGAFLDGEEGRVVSRCKHHMPGLVQDLRPGHPELRKCYRCKKRKAERYYFLDSDRAFCKRCKEALHLGRA